MHFDVIVLGSGPGGYVAAIRSSKLGLKTAIIEKDSIGGICLNWGCIPTKSLIKSANILQSIKKNGTLFGINPDSLKIDFSKIISNSRKSVERVKKGILFLMKKNGIHLIYGSAKLKKGKKIEIFRENKSVEIHSASNIIIATGSLPKIDKNIYDRKTIITYKEALTLSQAPKNMIIIGSGSVGLEFSYFYHSMGVNIMIIEMCEKLFPNGDDEISDYLKISFEKMGIKIYTSSYIKKIIRKENRVIVTIKDIHEKEFSLESDIVLYATGVVPNTQCLELEEIGIQTENKFIVVGNNYQTNIDGYYAIGDVINTPSLAHVASYEAISCVENIKGLDYLKIDYNNIPKCVYSFPEIASVGYTEKQSKDKGIKVKISKFPFSSLGKSISDGNTDGFVKVIFDSKYDEWIGCHMIGHHVTDLISEVVVARKLETTSYEMLSSIHPHPSLSESIIESIAMAYGKAIHF
ncbi:dihydrolipoyl dehydrogenase [Blattabacterium cuenoti]|uniref:dihydrolipoyl dehydrogenase n=1 Tax=Blattabacterium cuenoti TaxID=1653831 RepID=UPI00163CD01F|nr:dihydrolipoyl dehydrogenase [Blattabacterium cuenoti]